MKIYDTPCATVVAVETADIVTLSYISGSGSVNYADISGYFSSTGSQSLEGSDLEF